MPQKITSALRAMPFQKLRNRLTKRFAALIAVTVLILVVTVVALVNNGHGSSANQKPSTHQEVPKKEANQTSETTAVSEPSAVEEETPAPSANDAPTAIQTTPKPVAKTPVAPAPAPTPVASIDFSLSSTSVSIPLGSTSASIQAVSSTGQPLEWAVLVGGSVSAHTGLVSNGRTVTHTFSFHANGNYGNPGTYQATVMGYIPGGQKITKQVTIVVTPVQ